MKTYIHKPADVQKQWVLVDAEGVVLGRLASEIAKRLRGKNSAKFTPNVDCGDNVIVINAAKVKITGRKADAYDDTFFWHTGYPGGIKGRTKGQLLRGAYPERVIENAVRRMMPRGPLGRRQMGNLRVYGGAEHPHTAQNPVAWDIAAANPKNKRA
jgi:large subunit ribosomal protein L13